MRKVITIIMLCALTLSGCSPKGKPKDLPQEVYDIGVDVVNSSVKCLDGSMDPETLSGIVHKAFDSVEEIYDSLDTTERIKTLSIVNDLTAISTAIVNVNLDRITGSKSDQNKKELEKEVKDLKKDLGM